MTGLKLSVVSFAYPRAAALVEQIELCTGTLECRA